MNNYLILGAPASGKSQLIALLTANRTTIRSDCKIPKNVFRYATATTQVIVSLRVNVPLLFMSRELFGFVINPKHEIGGHCTIAPQFIYECCGLTKPQQKAVEDLAKEGHLEVIEIQKVGNQRFVKTSLWENQWFMDALRGSGFVKPQNVLS